MPSPNADLIKDWIGKDTTNVVSPNADLINQFVKGNGIIAEAPPSSSYEGGIKVKQNSNVDIPSNYVPQGAPDPSGYVDYAPKGAKLIEQTAKPVEWSKLPIVRQGIKGFKEGGELAGKGYSDISKGLSATGVGEVILGHGQQALNVIPILPTIEAGREQLEKITGNKEFSERAELVATSGLPISKAGKVVMETMPSTRAVKTIVDAIGPENIPTVIKQLQSNPRLTLTDIDPNVQVISQGLAAKPGEPRNILDKFVTSRKDTKLDTVTGALDEAMGIPVNVKYKVDSLKKFIKDTGKEINPIINSISNVDITPVVKNIDEKLKPGVQSVISMGEPLPLEDIQKSLKNLRQFLTDDKSFRTDAKSLHNFQSALRAKSEDLLSSQNGQDRQLGYALRNVRNQIVDAIDAASPKIKLADGTEIGSYKSKLAKYRDANNIDDAFKKGMLITKNRLGNLDDDPSYWEAWVKNATDAEKEAAREGARLTVSQQMGAARDAARKGVDVPLVEFNKEKLKLLFGKDEVEKMAKALSDERKIADTNSRLFQNSQTAMRLLGADATKVRPDYEPKFTKTILPVALEAGTLYLSGGNVPAAGFTAGLVYPFIRNKMTKVGQALDRKTNVEITNLATATGEARENLIKALQDYVPKGKLSLAQKSILALPIAKP